MRLDYISEGKYTLPALAAATTLVGGSMINNMLHKPRKPITKPQDVVSKMHSNEPIPTEPTQTSQTPDYTSTIARHEGVENTVYIDTRGNPTIGVGFNLNRPDADVLLRSVGANPADIRNGRASLTNDQINRLLQQDVDRSISAARNTIRDFDTLPSNVKLAMVDMVFNLGPQGFRNFRNMIAAVNNRDFETAANEMVNSRWYNQVGRRSEELVNLMRDEAR